MPLVKEFKEELLELKKQQAQNKAMCKRSYNRQDGGVDDEDAGDDGEG